MIRHVHLALTCLLLAGCGGGMTGALEREMVSSLQYDQLPCPDLVARRDALAAAHGIGADTSAMVPGQRPAYLVQGAGPLLPDSRSAEAKAQARALGEVSAMDRSIARRTCRGGAQG
jgi:hypothetical protein